MRQGTPWRFPNCIALASPSPIQLNGKDVKLALSYAVYDPVFRSICGLSDTHLGAAYSALCLLLNILPAHSTPDVVVNDEIQFRVCETVVLRKGSIDLVD